MCTHVLFLQAVKDFCGLQVGNSLNIIIKYALALKGAKKNDFPFLLNQLSSVITFQVLFLFTKNFLNNFKINWACTKTRNNETKRAKRNPRNEHNETTKTNKTKPPKQAKRNHRNKRNDQNKNQIRQIRYEANKTTSPRAIERQNYFTFRTLRSKAVL